MHFERDTHLGEMGKCVFVECVCVCAHVFGEVHIRHEVSRTRSAKYQGNRFIFDSLLTDNVSYE